MCVCVGEVVKVITRQNSPLREERKYEEEEEEEIEATDTSRCWRRQILKSGETNNRGVSPKNQRRWSRREKEQQEQRRKRKEHMYQKASQAALQRTSHVRKFVYSTLTTLNKRPGKGEERKVLNGLEVGAVTTEFCCQSPSWIRFRLDRLELATSKD